jgi:hypothetical protein
MVRIGLVVEPLDLDVSGGPIETDRFGQAFVRLELERPNTGGRSESLELSEQAPPDPEAARRLRDPSV